jgi:hypothetical protein
MGKGAVERGLKGLFQKESSKGGSETSPAQEQKTIRFSGKKKQNT